VLNPKLGCKPRVYYLNIPKKFIAGTVYDPIAKEVVISATCTLTGPRPSDKKTTTTDGFEDIWFEGLDEGAYNLKIKASGLVARNPYINSSFEWNIPRIPIGTPSLNTYGA
jgi:tetrathionate reductase subunit B